MAKKMSLFAKIMHAADYLADGISHLVTTGRVPTTRLGFEMDPKFGSNVYKSTWNTTNNEKEADKQIKTNNKVKSVNKKQETGLVEKMSKGFLKVFVENVHGTDADRKQSLLDKHAAAKESLTAQTAQLQQQTAATKETPASTIVSDKEFSKGELWVMQELKITDPATVEKWGAKADAMIEGARKDMENFLSSSDNTKNLSLENQKSNERGAVGQQVEMDM